MYPIDLFYCGVTSVSVLKKLPGLQVNMLKINNDVEYDIEPPIKQVWIIPFSQ